MLIIDTPNPESNKTDIQPEIESVSSIDQNKSFNFHPLKKFTPSLLKYGLTRPLMLALLLTFTLAYTFTLNSSDNRLIVSTNSSLIENTKSIIILPFVNNTNDESMKWLELGLSDMIASNLNRLEEIHVIPQHLVRPSFIANVKTSENSTTQDQLQREFQSDFIINTSISHRDENYLVSIAIRSNENKEIYIETKYENLLSAMSDISFKIASKLLPMKNDLVVNLASSKNKSANEDYAKGIQAYYTQGPKLAKHYFQAALINDPQFH